MPWTIAELAEMLYVAPGDIETVLSMYPDDVEELWSEAGVLSDLVCNDLSRVFDPYGVRTFPELFPTPPVGVVMVPRRVARVAGDSRVHRHSIRTGITCSGKPVETTEKGEDVSDPEPAAQQWPE
jgi:hypothetical protein